MPNKEVLFVAAENGALAGGKVGGIADVVRDLPAALHDHDWNATVVIPAYGSLHKLPGARFVQSLGVPFAGNTATVDIWEVPGSESNVRNIVIDAALFAANGPGQIYVNSETEGPFETDASKFAFFCAAVAEWLVSNEQLPDVIHLHDWHGAYFCLLRAFNARYQELQSIRTVFTIHNLFYQGTRPLRNHPSSLESWFPGMEYDLAAVQDLVASDCINPMAMAIRLADMVSTVSPTYAEEICRPSNPDTSFIGGEGLESLLIAAAADGRLTGVLNGCFYNIEPTGMTWPALYRAMQEQVSVWLAKSPEDKAHQLAAGRLTARRRPRPKNLLTSVGRLVAQKVTLLLADGDSGRSALTEIASEIGSSGLIVILGSGESKFEQAVLAVAAEHDNILFLKGYSETLAEPLYELGDLFLMPSSFEPCGISQMLAMRAAQPCVVHGVGGLRDTVEDEKTGFVFGGSDLKAQASGFVAATLSALALRRIRPQSWAWVRRRARQMRFEWSTSADATIHSLYRAADD